MLCASGFSSLLIAAQISFKGISSRCHKLYARNSCGRGIGLSYTVVVYDNGRALVDGGFVGAELIFGKEALDAIGWGKAGVEVLTSGADALADVWVGGSRGTRLVYLAESKTCLFCAATARRRLYTVRATCASFAASSGLIR